MPEVDVESRPAYDHLEKFFSETSFWEKQIEFMAQEPVRGERHDAFNSEHARFFKSIFGMWEDKFLGAVAPAVTALCAKSEDKNAQRTASELIGGLIRGSKHWKKGSLDGMWSWLSPLLKKTFQQCTPDSLVYWERFVKYCCLFRDPRRVLPLITLIFNTPLDSDSTAAFSESKNLFFTRAVLVSLSWRVSLLTPVLREECLRHITHPYKQVREILGHVINELFQLAPHPSYKSVKELLLDQAKQLDQPSSMVEDLDEKSAHQVQILKQNLASWKESHKPSIQGASDYSNASKTGKRK
jgi:proteasome activator subunit 4